MSIESKMKELGIILPNVPDVAGLYSYYRTFGDKLVYISGCGPAINGVNTFVGKVGREINLEQGQEAARNCILNALAIIKANLGDLSQIKSFVKLLGFVACSDDFYDQPKVMNGASKLLSDIFGEQIGLSARSAIGTNVLPGNISVEIELIIELK